MNVIGRTVNESFHRKMLPLCEYIIRRLGIEGDPLGRGIDPGLPCFGRDLSNEYS